MILSVIYLSFFALGGLMAFLIVRGTRINEMFQQGKVFEIRLFYIFVCLFAGHIIGSIAYRIANFYL